MLSQKVDRVRRGFEVGLLATALLAANLGSAKSAEHVPDTIEARVAACASCHGAKGEGTGNAYFPWLAGEPPAIFTISFWRSGMGAATPPMTYLLEYLSEEYLKAMAEYFASQRPPLPSPAIPDVSQDMLAHGEQLVRQRRLRMEESQPA